MSRETWNVMLVDDNGDDRAHVKSLLRQDEGRRYKFVEAASGDAAHARFQEVLPDAILLDYHLPDMDAAAFLTLLKGAQEHPPCPVVILTGSASDSTAKAALQAGAQDYVGKSWMTSHGLSRVIENARERWHMTHRLIRHRRDLETSERFCRAIMESSPDSIQALDTDGRILSANAAAVQRLGMSNEEALLGRLWPEIWPEANRPLADDAISSAKSGLTYRFRSQSCAAEGLERWWDSIVTPLRDCNTNEITGLLATSRDVTEQKRAEDAAYAAQTLAEAANKGKDQFLATLSHELRNPLNPVSMVAGEMLRSPSLTPDSREAWQLVLRNVSLQAALVDDLLDLSRITQGKMELNYLEIDVHQILANALETTRGALESKGLRLTLCLEASRKRLWGDHVRLQQVFWNLLSNAIKFTPNGGEIKVSTSNPEPDTLRISVSDSGVGMNSTELARVFRPFEQGDHSAEISGSRGGLGLGLAITRQLVEMHAGSVVAESEGKGRGARFTVNLPISARELHHEARFRSQPRPAVAGAESPHATPCEPMKLLVVDDDLQSREMLARLLRRRGHTVAIAGSLAEARLLASAGSFQVLLADLGLPDGSGHELMVEIRRDYIPSIYGIAISGYGTAEDLAASRLAGFSAHIVKPLRLEMLEKELHRLSLLVAGDEMSD